MDGCLATRKGYIMRVGSLVKYKYSRYDDDLPVIGTILYVNEDGGTLKVLDKNGKVDWFVTSYCEVISDT